MSEWGRSMKGDNRTGSFVELRGRPWLVEEVQGELTDLQTQTFPALPMMLSGSGLKFSGMLKSGPSCSMRMAGGMSVPAFLIVRKC